MRESTVQRYSESINNIIKTDVKINRAEFPEKSRTYFNNFVALHHLLKAGCLQEVGREQYTIKKDIPVSIMIQRIEKLQKESAKRYQMKAAKRLKEGGKRKKSEPIADGNSITIKPKYQFSIEDTGEMRLRNIPAEKLVSELRERGFVVSCKQTIEL